MFSDNNDDDNKVMTIGRIDIDASKFVKKPDLSGLPILVTKNLVLFPEVVVPVALGRESAIRLASQASKDATPIGVVCQLDSNDEHPDLSTGLCSYGVVADVLNVFDLPDGSKTALLKSRKKFKIEQIADSGDFPVAKVRISGDRVTDPDSLRMIMESVRNANQEILSAAPDGPVEEIKSNMKAYTDDARLLDYLCTVSPVETSDKMDMLASGSYNRRAELLLSCLFDRLEKIKITREIMMKAKENIDNNNRNAFLQQQMETIREELYGDSDEADRLLKRADELNLPEQARAAFDKELSKLRRLNPTSPDYAVAYSYIETLLDLPWGRMTDFEPHFDHAREVLEADHYGLEKVKERILEQLALIINNPGGKAPILCLVGPPGVGKTSLGKSVAKALGRNYQRVSLGGLHDEAEIRGHRRTYIGAMPGRIIETIKRCGSSNPVIILDEVDKITVANHGDPSSALLEVLDPEQNTTFHDNYLDTEYDLSKVLFIATANNVGNISPALRDRMEMINIPGYILEDKLRIAADHLVAKQREAHGIPQNELSIPTRCMEKIIADYTRESGVRSLDKHIAKIARHRAKSIALDEPYNVELTEEDVETILGKPKFRNDSYDIAGMVGVVTGLAWTEVGGDILYIESILTPGKGKLSLTGNLGDVMKESATIAYEWVMAHHVELGIDRNMFEQNDLNIHVPEGAIPKDGPSAGITMLTSIVSTFTSRPPVERIAMTGETTLRGRVTAVGGIKEKILAAKRAGITALILSEDNRKDIEEIKPEYVEGLTFHYVRTNDEVLKLALQS